ncbi:chaperonin 10-like protein [Fomitopsis serialis]|uniref:chaperonin 10-like protein n=1 Tax=Fomitopsis serialis TaxID=139415 RepID=UPI002007DA8F|nr:chaperonin 10-like protein [Neoantrodia serialis]KAH9921855.1 chaperonin 10-like protein [Neoantrodia serialis]
MSATSTWMFFVSPGSRTILLIKSKFMSRFALGTTSACQQSDLTCSYVLRPIGNRSTTPHLHNYPFAMSVPKIQKALVLPAKYADFVVRSIAVPKPGPGQLLVKVHAVGLNPVDWKIQKNGIIVQEFPGIVGSDVAGTVEELGEGVKGFSLGDKVVEQGHFAVPNAGFQQYTVANADITAKIPDNITFEQAATLPVGLSTAALGLYEQVVAPDQDYGTLGLQAPWEEGGRGKYAGKPFVVIGAGSSVGQYVIQFAKLSGFSPIIATASLHNAEFLRSLGATHVLDRNLTLEQLREETAKITKEPLDLIYDSVALPETQLASYELLAPGGTLALVLYTAIPEERLRPDKKIVRPFGQANFPVENRTVAAEVYGKQLTTWLKEGVIKPNRVEVLPNGLEGIVDGLERLRNHSVSGVKLVAHPQETV